MLFSSFGQAKKIHREGRQEHEDTKRLPSRSFTCCAVQKFLHKNKKFTCKALTTIHRKNRSVFVDTGGGYPGTWKDAGHFSVPTDSAARLLPRKAACPNLQGQRHPAYPGRYRPGAD